MPRLASGAPAPPRRPPASGAGALRRRRRPGRRALCSFVAALAGRWLLGAAARAFVPAPRTAPPAEPEHGTAGIGASAAAPWLLAAASGTAGAGAAFASPDAATVVASAAVEGNINPADAILQAFLLTFVSEIGDKTFFIAAILAAGGSQGGLDGKKDGANQKLLTFVGAIAALAVMTLLAVGLGQIFHAVPDVAGGVPVDDYASILAFGFFGVKLLLDATNMSDDGSLLEEKEEAEEEVKKSLPTWVSDGVASIVLPPVVLQAFILVFAAEIGDRSFISAAALSAQGGPGAATAVFIGGISAHAIATLGAVLLGDLISKFVTERQLAFIGGVLFLIFAATSAANVVGVQGFGA